MKSYEEVTDSLLERRNRYMAVKTRRRKKVTIVATSLCCCCLVSILNFGIWKSSTLQSGSPVAMDSTVAGNYDSDLNGSEQLTTNSNMETGDNPNVIDQSEIYILEIEKLPNVSEKMFFALMCDDFIPMDHDEIIAYYGVNIFPIVPSDLKGKDIALGIYKRKSSGELYYDGNRMEYLNVDSSRGVAVNVDKDCMPFDFCNIFANIQTRSIINNIEVGIAQTPMGDMYAEFMYQNVGFRIFACGLTQEELIAAIASLLD